MIQARQNAHRGRMGQNGEWGRMGTFYFRQNGDILLSRSRILARPPPRPQARLQPKPRGGAPRPGGRPEGRAAVYAAPRAAQARRKVECPHYFPKTAVVKLLLERGANPNLCSWADVCPIWWATKSGSYETVKLLIESGANVNKEPWGRLA